MMSLRNVARSAPRAISRVSAAAYRAPAASLLSKTTPFGASALRTVRQPAAAFSSSVLRRAPAGEADEELVAKLESEIGFETEVKESEEEPASIKDFLENGPFKLQDTPGQEKVVLTREFGNEKITVNFTIADLASYEQDQAMYDEDPALGDESEGGAGKQSSSEVAEEDADEEEFDDQGDGAVPCRLSVVVEKPNQGALKIEAVAQSGQVEVENVFFYKDAALAHSETAEVSHKSADTYPGPPFGTLDEDLQVLMERYLEERGVTAALAVFVPDYMDVKEQKEYISWLKNVKSFIEA